MTSRRDILRQRLPTSLRIYVLTDRTLARGRSEIEVARAAIAGGATAIQLRWKVGPLWDAIQAGEAVRDLCRERDVLFVVNDRVDLAMVLDADGVHLGDEDLPINEARKLVGDRMLIGYSPPTLVEAIQAERLGADYLGIGPVYGTTTKSDAGEPVGLKRIGEVRRSVSIPFVGIGGINAANAAPVLEAGADGVAVISSIVAADDIVEATNRLRQALDAAGRQA